MDAFSKSSSSDDAQISSLTMEEVNEELAKIRMERYADKGPLKSKSSRPKKAPKDRQNLGESNQRTSKGSSREEGDRGAQGIIQLWGMYSLHQGQSPFNTLFPRGTKLLISKTELSNKLYAFLQGLATQQSIREIEEAVQLFEADDKGLISKHAINELVGAKLRQKMSTMQEGSYSKSSKTAQANTINVDVQLLKRALDWKLQSQ